MTTAIQTAGSTAAEGLPSSAKAKRPRDPRYIALRNFALSISVFNIFGYTLLGFEQPWLWPLLAVATAYATEMSLETISAWAYKRKPRFTGNGPRGLYEFLLPSHITALAVNMLIYANNQWWPVMFGVMVGVSGKYILQAPIYGRMRHYMNPSNLGIAATLIVFSTWVSIAPPYEFTEWANTYFKLMIPLIVITAGTVLNATLTKKVPLIVGWMGAFAIQAFVRHWIWDVQLFSALGVMTGAAFVLFTNYMITDPGTSPSKPLPMFMFGSAVGVVYGILMAMNIVDTLFFATAIVCGFRGLGWWAVHWRKRFLARRRAALDLTSGAEEASGVAA
jgi:hypothetical protein